MLLLLPLLVFIHLSSCLELTPPQNIWVRKGQTNVTLLCLVSKRIQSCSWRTPYGKVYPLQTGLRAEKGRLMHYTTDNNNNNNKKECGLMITNLEPKDEGRWACNVGVVENNEVTTASGMANISIAVAPATAILMEPFHLKKSNMTTDGLEQKVKCVAASTKPAPTFSWSIGDEELVDLRTTDAEVMLDVIGLSTFTQTLYYIPIGRHANRSLQCRVSHPGLNEDLISETRILFDTPPFSTTGINVGVFVGIGVAVAVVLVILSLLCIFFKKRIVNKDKVSEEKNDEEKLAITEPEVDKGSATESAECVVTDEEEAKEVKKISLQTKITTFFSSLKGKKIEDTTATEWEKVNLDDKDDEKKDENEKKTIGSKMTSLLAKIIPEKKVEEKEVEVAKKENIESTKEEQKEEEGDEDKTARRGSETPV